MGQPEIKLEIRPHNEGDLFYIAKVGQKNPVYCKTMKTYRISKEQAEKTLKAIELDIAEQARK
jgi:hypothetical protein